MPTKSPARKRKSTKRSTAAARRRRPAAPRPSPDEMTRMASAGPPAGERPLAAVLRVLRSPDAGLLRREFPVGGDDVTLGRDDSNVIAVADPDVSRHHARIVRTGGSHILVDMESTNGTSVNGKQVSEVTLRPGDRVVLGSTTLVYQA